MRHAASTLKERRSRREEQSRARFEEQSKLVSLEIDGLADEYDELADTWKFIDTKAQITAAAAGIFLGGIFAFQRTPNVNLPVFDKIAICAALLFLVLSIFFAFRALEIRDFDFPPRGIAFEGVFDRLYGTAEFMAGGVGLQERTLRCQRDQIRKWREVNETTQETITHKASWVLRAQSMLALGGFVFAGLSVYEMFSK